MSKRILWLLVSGLMALSLVMAACAPAATPISPTTPTAPTAPTTPSSPPTPTAPTTPPKPAEEPTQKESVAPTVEVPKYGGTLTLAQSGDPVRFTTIEASQSTINEALVNEELWGGDWTKGIAGGYGTKEADWVGSSNLWHLNAGVIAVSTKWTVDEEKSQGTVVYQIRQGVHYALNPKSEASRLVGGRELTADDVIFHLKQLITDPNAFVYQSTPGLRTAEITKTAPWEITVKVRLEDLISAIDRFGDSAKLVPPEVVQRYGGQKSWRDSVGTGAFMLTDYVAGSLLAFDRNSNYWMKDPIGPGKGSQLPYLDSVRVFIIPDASTRQAALRTGKIDQIDRLAMEDAEMMKRTAPGLKEYEVQGQLMTSVAMRIDMPPFNDLRVRRAMLMAIDFKGLYQSVAGGKGRVLRRPVDPMVKGYETLMVEFNDPEKPESVKENYSYNPEKARQLLKEAGYPNGLKTTALMTSAQVDDWSIYKDFWAKIGVDVDFMVREAGAYNTLRNSKQHPPLTATSGYNPGIFYAQTAFTGAGSTNVGMHNDPFMGEISAKARLVAVKEGLPEAMRLIRKMTIYVLEQAFEIPGIDGAAYRMWWPWLKNYSGEDSVGYGNPYWSKFVWLDEELKRSRDIRRLFITAISKQRIVSNDVER